jgi:rubrerythrin
MRPLRCRICGETYLGAYTPDRCPFCGATRANLVPASEWVRQEPVENLSETSKELILRSLALELSNTAFYRAVSKATSDTVTQGVFNRLSKQELEHAELDCKMLGMPLPDLPVEEAKPTDEESYAESAARERRAIALYVQVQQQAPEPRVREVFAAFTEIEANHLELSASHLL